MILPVSQRARDLVASLRIELARSLAMQLELLAVDGEMDVDDALRESLARGLSDPPPLDDRELRAIVTRYVEGPQPFDAAAYALCPFVEQNRDRLDRLDPRARRLVEGRVLARRSWAAVAREAGYPSVPSAQRALRPAIAALLA
jgi:tRNA(Met) C34 N-acetyltransferase TmcA